MGRTERPRPLLAHVLWSSATSCRVQPPALALNGTSAAGVFPCGSEEAATTAAIQRRTTNVSASMQPEVRRYYPHSKDAVALGLPPFLPRQSIVSAGNIRTAPCGDHQPRSEECGAGRRGGVTMPPSPSSTMRSGAPCIVEACGPPPLAMALATLSPCHAAGSRRAPVAPAGADWESSVAYVQAAG